MRIAMVPVDGVILRALVVDKSSPSAPCENCGKPMYSHELLAKTSEDWCMACDDEHHRGKMSEKELTRWTIEQMAEGLAVIVVTQDKPDYKLTHLGL